jgi:hypothetical protein
VSILVPGTSQDSVSGVREDHVCCALGDHQGHPVVSILVLGTSQDNGSGVREDHVRCTLGDHHDRQVDVAGGD